MDFSFLINNLLFSKIFPNSDFLVICFISLNYDCHGQTFKRNKSRSSKYTVKPMFLVWVLWRTWGLKLWISNLKTLYLLKNCITQQQQQQHLNPKYNIRRSNHLLSHWIKYSMKTKNFFMHCFIISTTGYIPITSNFCDYFY